MVDTSSVGSPDPFLAMTRSARPSAPLKAGHAERAHSKFSASAAERWTNCSGSVELSEGLPDRTTKYALEGTRAHEVLERVMLAAIAVGGGRVTGAPQLPDMERHAIHAANIILGLHAKTPNSEVMVETRIYLDFIHPEMFGTFDGAVVDHFGTLHVFDYKYGSGRAVSPKENLQMIFYGIGLAARYQWNFKRVRLWIIQPRIPGYEGPLYWEITTPELWAYVDLFKRAVDRVLSGKPEFKEGPWCHYCRARQEGVCPLKQEAKLEKANQIFSRNFTTFALEKLEQDF